MKKLLLLLAVWLAIPLQAHAVTAWVDDNGAVTTWANCQGSTPISGAAACTWQTAMANANDDDIVYFRGGTYNPGNAPDYEHPAMRPTGNGSSGHPITFMAYPGETVVIVGNTVGPAFGGYNCSWIIWDGFTGTTVNAAATVTDFFYYQNCTDSILRNCDLTGYDETTASNSMIVRVEASDRITITNNYLHDMVSTTGESGHGENTTAIWLFGGSGGGGTYYDVSYNTISNCTSGVMMKTQSHVGHTIHHNFFVGIERRGVYLNDQGSGSNVSVYRNVMANVAQVGVFFDHAGTDMLNYLIYNNTIYNSPIGITCWDKQTGTQIWNNIIYRNSPTSFLRYHTTDAPTFLDYNDYYGSSPSWMLNYGLPGQTAYASIATWRTATGMETNSVTTDPGFIELGGTDAADYKRSSYPTNGRGGAYDTVMGAYPNSDYVIGYTTPGAPECDEDGDCNDSNVCTDDTCISGDCVYTNDNTNSCTDSKVCTDDACVSGICVSTNDDTNTATDDGLYCNGPEACSSGSIVHTGNPCTSCDTCNEGTNSCDVTKDTDSDTYIDDACSGGDDCDDTVASVNPGAIEGPSAQGSCTDEIDNDCDEDIDEEDSGCLAPGNCNDASDCNDSNVCTTDTCEGEPLACVNTNNTAACASDSNPCTDDVCAAGACTNVNNVLPCNDGNACTEDEACAAGSCTGGTPVDCDDSNDCTDDSCNSGTGCINANNTAACNDGLYCTEVDACSGGSCGGTTRDCKDSNLFTKDTCNDTTDQCDHTTWGCLSVGRFF